MKRIVKKSVFILPALLSLLIFACGGGSHSAYNIGEDTAENAAKEDVTPAVDPAPSPEPEQPAPAKGNETPSDEPEPVPDPVPAFVEFKHIDGTSFWMSNHEVTQADYKAVEEYSEYQLNFEPSTFKSDPDEGEVQENRPVETVTWYDAVYYCNLLTKSKNHGKTSECVYAISGVAFHDGHIVTATVELVNDWEQKKGYRLPTDVEWKLAAGNLPAENIGEYAWYKDNSKGKTHEVMKGKLSVLSLYNMFGNVMEWVWDKQGIIILPSGNELKSEEDYRRFRGGSYDLSQKLLDPSIQQGRGWAMRPDFTDKSLGFRICSSFNPDAN